MTSKMTKKILLITDAWAPQINGVVTTLTNVVDRLKADGHEVMVFSPENCPVRFPLPTYPEIVLGIPRLVQCQHAIDLFRPDHIHISTPEGPLGTIFRFLCDRRGKKYSTAYHTKFPEFLNAKLPWVRIRWGRKFMRWINRHSEAILVPAPSIYRELEEQGFENIIQWSRGIDDNIFNPGTRTDNEEKTLVCVSRVSREKNLEDFFRLPYKKIMVGGGPQLEEYKKRYPEVEFVGMKTGHELADYYRKGDVFVFPSRTDTFGVVMIESLACGTPIAAYDVTGPRDIVKDGINGYKGESLEECVEKCFELSRQPVYESSKIYTWKKATKDFLDSLIQCD
jgi:glycosyltransferase involved in cell wall biosynthesis